VILFITFRLAGSIPQSKLSSWSREKAQWLRDNPEPHNDLKQAEYYKEFSARLQKWLDAGEGPMLFRDPALREIVETALLFFDGERYLLDECVVAGNHVHALLVVKAGFELAGILHSWKSFTAKKILGKLREQERQIPESSVWQQESWDHLVRSEASLKKFRLYIQRHGGSFRGKGF